MAPVKEKKTWKEINKAHKEERKKWKQEHLLKKIEKQNIKVVSNENSETPCSLKIYDNVSTISIAVPGSIIENAQSPELRTYLAGQIARAACIFQADEIVIFDDYADSANARKDTLDDGTGIKTARRCCVQLGRILQYLECPQYLRKLFFPIHKDLKFAGILNPLDAPHHLRAHNNFAFREGVITNKPAKSGRGSLVNVGLLQDVHVDKLLTPGIRCTVRMLPHAEGSKKLKGTIVSPNTPRKETGVYWGYTVRLANSLSQVFSQSIYKEGYDLTIGTSDKGDTVDGFICPKYQHLLIMFGGLQGIEAALENDEILQEDDPSLLFDYYLNTLPEQGSRTIRTEEAVLVTMAALRPKLNPICKPMAFIQIMDIAQSSETNEKLYDHKNTTKETIHNTSDDLSKFD